MVAVVQDDVAVVIVFYDVLNGFICGIGFDGEITDKGLGDSDNVLHGYKPPFCERHQLGHETVLPLMFQNCYTYLVELAHYRTRGGEWRGCIAATPYGYMVSVIRKGINEWRKTVARKLISSEVDSISPDDQSLPAL